MNIVRPSSFVLRAFSFSVALASLAPIAAKAQFSEGLLLAADPLPNGSRGMAMGGSLISAADGIDALAFNPAALAPIASSEFTLSLFNRGSNSTADFLGSSSDASLSQFSLSSIGVAYPYPTVKGHLALGVSFDRVQDYTGSYSFSAVNPNSSLFNTEGFLDQPNTYGNHNSDYLENNNFAYALGLTYAVPDSGPYQLTTPFNGGNLESGTVTTSGSLNAVRIGGGVDIAEGVSVGATLNLLFGEYDYNRSYTETNVNNISTGTDTLPPSNFQKATITDALSQQQSGGSIKFGLLVNENIFRFGLTLETPQVIHIDQTESRSGVANYVGLPPYYASITYDDEQIDVVTPLRLGVGASVHIAGLTGSASASYINLSQLQFQNSSFNFDALNQTASDSLRAVLSWQVGAEYVIPGIGLAVRAGFAYEPSPYKGDASSYDTKIISAGLGVPVGKSFEIEAVYRHSTYNTIYNIYQMVNGQSSAGDANITSDAVTQSDIAMTFEYKF